MNILDEYRLANINKADTKDEPLDPLRKVMYKQSMEKYCETCLCKLN
jgi:hypothetical protein